MDVEGVSLNGNVCVPSVCVLVGSDLSKSYSPHSDVFWVSARVRGYSSGTLSCELSDVHPGKVNMFFSQTVDPAVARLILTGGDILSRLTGGRQPIPPRVRHNNHGERNSSQSGVHERAAPSVIPSLAPAPTSEPQGASGYPIREYTKDFTFRFQGMRIVDGAALFSADFDIPYFRKVFLTLRVENDFLTDGFEYIKPYIANRLGKHKVVVTATIQTQGPEVISTRSTASVVDEITPALIVRVKHWYIRRELRKVEAEKELVTVDDLFNQEEIEKSNIKPTDAEFVDDILAIKKPKHGDHIRYLSARHLHQQMRLRLLKKPFAFLFLIFGKQECFLVLETLNSKEATYLWNLNVTPSEFSKNTGLLKKKFEWVEQEISVISAEGRDVYKENAVENFIVVRHDYESGDGFDVWKDRLHQVLERDSRPNTPYRSMLVGG